MLYAGVYRSGTNYLPMSLEVWSRAVHSPHHPSSIYFEAHLPWLLSVSSYAPVALQGDPFPLFPHSSCRPRSEKKTVHTNILLHWKNRDRNLQFFSGATYTLFKECIQMFPGYPLHCSAQGRSSLLCGSYNFRNLLFGKIQGTVVVFKTFDSSEVD